MNDYLKTFREEVCTVPFALLISVVFLSFVLNTCLFVDGAGFSFAIHFTGTMPNPSDFTRTVATLTTSFPALLYNWLGGTHYGTSLLLFNMGHHLHFFIPFLYLVYLRYKHPELNTWVRSSSHYYVVSLLFLRALSFLFVVSELNVAHSLSWVILFAFRSRSLISGREDDKENVIWTVSLLSLLTYPTTIFTFSILALSQTVNPVDRPSTSHKDWRRFFLVLVVLNFLILMLYKNTIPSLGLGFFEQIVKNKMNSMAWMVLGMFIVCFILKPVFRYQNYAVALFFCIAYILANVFHPWHSYVGRTFAAFVIAVLQAFYIFFFNEYARKNAQKIIRESVLPFAIACLMVMVNQGWKIQKHHNFLTTLLHERKGIIPFDEIDRIIKPSLAYYLNDWNIQALSIILQLKDKNEIQSMVMAKPGKQDGLFTAWSAATMKQKFREKQITFSDAVIPPDHEENLFSEASVPGSGTAGPSK